MISNKLRFNYYFSGSDASSLYNSLLIYFLCYKIQKLY